MMLVACLTSLVALNGKNHAGTGNSAAFTVTQPLERAQKQNDAFGPPNEGAKAIAEALKVNPVLTKLNLQANDLGDAGKKAVRDAVKDRSGFVLEHCEHVWIAAVSSVKLFPN